MYGLNYVINKVKSEDKLLVVDDVHDTGNSINQIIVDLKKACEKNHGSMAAILGLNFTTVQSLAVDAQAAGICQAANDNDPSQVVISGEKAAVELAIELAKNLGAKRAIMLPVSAPFHCELMAPAA